MAGGLLSRWRTLLGHRFCDFSGPLHVQICFQDRLNATIQSPAGALSAARTAPSLSESAGTASLSDATQSFASWQDAS